MGLRDWLRGKFAARPINHVNHVELPAVDDPKWELSRLTSAIYGQSNIRAETMSDEYGSWAYLVVDDVRWITREAQTYARAVVTNLRLRYDAEKMERSRAYARQISPNYSDP